MENKSSMKKLVLLCLSVMFLSGCTISQKKQFEKVQVGMDKDQVLTLLDSPQRTQRWHGMDRWTYIFYEQDFRFEKEIHFDEGNAKYVGDVYKPEISADEQDKKNEAANLEVEALLQARKDDNSTAYPRYEERTHGTDGVRYVPQFGPVQ